MRSQYQYLQEYERSSAGAEGDAKPGCNFIPESGVLISCRIWAGPWEGLDSSKADSVVLRKDYTGSFVKMETE